MDYDVVITPDSGELTVLHPDFLFEQLKQGVPDIIFNTAVGSASGTSSVIGFAVGVGLISSIGFAAGAGDALGSGTVAGSIVVTVGSAAGVSGVNGVATGVGLLQGVGSASGTGFAAAVGTSTGITPSVGYSTGLGGANAVGISSSQGSAAGIGALAAMSSAVSGWQNTTVTNQTAQFKCECDAVPTVAALDDLVGLSNAPANAYSGLACIIRFNNTGSIDVRNGGAYAADATISYTAGTSYHIRIMGDLVAKTYDVYITPAGGTETKIATAYAFRTEQNTVTNLNNFAIAPATVGGAILVTNLTMVLVTSPPVVSAMTFTLTLPASSGQVVGTVTASGSPTSWAITAAS
jgi:hypothetical protein